MKAGYEMGYIKELRKQVGTVPLIMVGACVLIFDKENRLLLQLRKDNGCWGLAGGSMDLGESLEEVVIREMEEETGLSPKSLTLLKVFSGQEFYYQYPHGDEVYNVVAAYECRNYYGSLKEDATEAIEVKFFSLDSLPENISPPDRPIIENYLTELLLDS